MSGHLPDAYTQHAEPVMFMCVRSHNQELLLLAEIRSSRLERNDLQRGQTV